MTIKQQGGIFGRNPTFNNVDVEGTLTTDTFTAASVTTESISTVNTDATSYASSSGSSIQPSGGVSSEIRNDSNGGFSWLKLRTTNSAAAIGYISYYNQGGGVVAGNMAFGGRTGSSSYNERMSLDMADGDLTLNTGNLVIGTSGKGIDFSATSGTGTSELFDDYEEGTHVVTATPETSGTLTLDTAFDRDTFRYTKIGQRVFVAGALQFSAVGSPVGTWFSVSLPFAVANVFGNSDYSIGLARQTNTGSLFGVTLDGGQSVAKVLLAPSTISTGSGGRIYINFDYVT